MKMKKKFKTPISRSNATCSRKVQRSEDERELEAS